MRLQLHEDPREWRRFTLTALGAPTLLTSLLAWRRVLPLPLYLLCLALLGAIAIAALVRPRWFRGLYRAGMTLGFHLVQALAFAILTLIFWIVVLPVGLCLRIVGHDPLRLRRDRQRPSYWQDAPAPGPLENMF